MNDPAQDFAKFLIAHSAEFRPVDLQRGMEALQAYSDELELAITDGLDISAVLEKNKRDWEKQKEAINGTGN